MQHFQSKQKYNNTGFNLQQSPYLNDNAYSQENFGAQDETFVNKNLNIQDQPTQIIQETPYQLGGLIYQQENIDTNNSNVQNDNKPSFRMHDMPMNQTGNNSYRQIPSSLNASQKFLRSSGMSTKYQTPMSVDKKAYSPTTTFEQFEKLDPSKAIFECPGGIKPLVSKTSKAIMKRVFDEEFSMESPSKKKLMEKSMNDISQFNKSTSFTTEQRELQNKSKIINTSSIDYQYLEVCQKSYFEVINSGIENPSETLDEQLNMTAQNFTHPNQEIRIQSTQAAGILSLLFEQLPKFYDSQDFYMQIITLEIISKII